VKHFFRTEQNNFFFFPLLLPLCGTCSLLPFTWSFSPFSFNLYRKIVMKKFTRLSSVVFQFALKLFCLLILLFISEAYSQTFIVKGNVSTAGTIPVQYASITFIDEIDTIKKYSALTDTLGNYKIDIITSVRSLDNLPNQFELAQNYPNPFSSSTSISYKLNEQSNISVRIYNILGQRVKEFKVGIQAAGVRGIVWDGTNEIGRKVPPGVYLYQLMTGNKSEIKKMLFGVGNINTILFGFKDTYSSSRKLPSNASLSVEGVNYKVRIEETENTQPRILADEFECAMTQKDTVINYTVEGGKIVFSSTDSLGRDHLYVVNPDGTELTQLTSGAYGQGMPRWSPDGKQIVFVSDSLRTSLGNAMFIMNSDGSNIRAVKEFHDNPTYTFYQPGDWPNWSPDGKKIVFAWCAHCGWGLMTWDIYLDLITGEMNQLTYGDPLSQGDSTKGYPICSNSFPVWSPDGEKIYFRSTRDGSGEPNADIYSMNIDGSNVERITITQDISKRLLCFSPDGKRIVFARGPSDVNNSLFTSNADGSNSSKLVDPSSGYIIYSPQWLPSGKRIMFVSGGISLGGIYIVNFDGTDLRTLELGNISVGNPNWKRK